MRFVVADTSFLIDAMERSTSRSRDRLVELLQAVAAGAVTLVAPAPVVAELYRGAGRDEALASRYDRVLASLQILSVTEGSARLAAALAIGTDLREVPRSRRPGIVDAMVAQAADELNAELLTTDAHFRLFNGVKVTVLSAS
jgi:predicted nucleic acid-binding protein